MPPSPLHPQRPHAVPPQHERGEGTIVMEGAIRSRLMEALELTTDDYRGYSVPLKVSLSGSVTSGSDTFKVPANYHFLVTDIRGLLALTAMTTEPATIPGIGNPQVRDRIALKAMNSLVKLIEQDGQYDLIDHATLPVAAILEQAGGSRIDMRDAPMKIPANNTVELDVTLYDTTAAIIGGNYDVGVVLSGYLVKAREG